MEKLDGLVAEHIEQRLLQPKRLEQILSAVLHRRQERTERRTPHIAGAENLRRPGPQAHVDRVGRLPAGPPARAGPARRSGRERGSHHGVEKRTAAHACRGFERKNDRFWSARFCTEMARSERFELIN
jgi:hypothetical protein